jgi:hypothetical protein
MTSSTAFNAFRITSDSAEPVQIPLGLKSLQQEVGGMIEAAFTVPSPDGGNRYVTGYVNEEGLLIGLPMCLLTADGNSYSGNCIIIGLDYSTGETIPLSATELAWVAGNCEKIMTLTPLGREPLNLWGLDLTETEVEA